MTVRNLTVLWNGPVTIAGKASTRIRNFCSATAPTRTGIGNLSVYGRQVPAHVWAVPFDSVCKRKMEAEKEKLAEALKPIMA